MKLLKTVFIFLLCFSLAFPAFAQTPKRLFFVTHDGVGQDVQEILRLVSSEFAACGYEVSTVCGEATLARSGDIVIEANTALPVQGFQIVAGDCIHLYYADCDGLFYGLRHLLQMLLSGDVHSFADAPDTKERTLMLDCARKYFSPEFICNLIRQMSWMGMNTLELHLTEEQGIRADIWDETYFQSENDYSWLCGSEAADWVYDCPDPDAGKYLTAEELTRIISVARQYRIEIIPSFNSPGHCEYLCKVFEDYVQENPDYTFTFLGTTYQTDSIRSNRYSTIDLSNEAARAFVHSVMLDYAKFFSNRGSTKFNLCADEITLDESWATESQSAYDVFTEYVNETAQHLKGLGYKVRAFNDFLSFQTGTVPLDPDIDIVYWHTPTASDACEAADFIAQGRTVYNAVQNYTYYALRVFNSPGLSDRPSWGLDARDENNSWWSFSRGTAERVFSEWNPSKLHEYTDENKTVVQNDQLGGSYFLIWCDYAGLATEEEIWSGEYPLLERLWAHSAKAWNWRLSDYETFRTQISSYYEFAGFTHCSEAPELPQTDEIRPISFWTNLSAIETLREELPTGSQEAYQSLLRSGQVPYGAFGRKIS